MRKNIWTKNDLELLKKYALDGKTIEEIEELLEKSKWYDLPIEELKKYVDYSKEPKRFANEIIKDYKQE